MTFKRPNSAGLAALAILAGLCAIGFADAALAQTAPAAADAAKDAAPAAAAAAPVPNKGDTAWMLVSSALVLMMSIPGLALFYGGLVRTKNMASVLTQVFAIVSMIGVTWTLYGYSMAFTDGGSMTPWVGGFSKAFLHGVDASFDGGDLLQRRRHSGTRLLRVPDDLRDDHPGPDRRRLRRAHQVLGGDAVHPAVVDLHLLPDRALGLVRGRSR